MYIPANYAIYLGNVPDPQGILRNRTTKRNRHYEDYQEQRRESSQLSRSCEPSQQMDPRDIVLDKSITDSEYAPNSMDRSPINLSTQSYLPTHAS